MNRKAPLKRKTGLRRKRPMVRYRPKAKRRNSYARRPRDTDRMLWIKTRACVVFVEQLRDSDSGWPCWGEVEADHIGEIGERALGRKCPDDETVPLCTRHHAQRTGRNGYFDGWDIFELRAWARKWIAVYQRLYASVERAPDPSE